MLRNHWITKDYFTKNISVNFVEPDLACFNTMLHLTSKEDLRYLLAAEIGEGWKFQTEFYILRYHCANGLELILPASRNFGEYIYTDLLQQVVGEYLAELEIMEAFFHNGSEGAKQAAITAPESSASSE